MGNGTAVHGIGLTEAWRSLSVSRVAQSGGHVKRLSNGILAKAGQYAVVFLLSLPIAQSIGSETNDESSAEPLPSAVETQKQDEVVGWDEQEREQFKKAFKNIVDDYEEQDEARLIEPEPLKEILKRLAKVDAAALSTSINEEATFIPLMKTPEQFRGEVVRLSGILRKVVEKKINPPFEDGTKSLYYGQLSNASGQIISFLAVQKPVQDTGKGVSLVGYFLKRHTYLNNEPGDRLTWCPLVVVKEVLDFSPIGNKTQSNSMFEMVGTITFVLIALALFFLLYQRKMVSINKLNIFSRRKESREKTTQSLFPKSKRKFIGRHDAPGKEPNGGSPNQTPGEEAK